MPKNKWDGSIKLKTENFENALKSADRPKPIIRTTLGCYCLILTKALQSDNENHMRFVRCPSISIYLHFVFVEQ